MGLVRAFTDAVGGTLADQWIDTLTPGHFDEHVVVAPGVQNTDSRGRGVNAFEQEGVITNGSRIFVPENTAAFIFYQASIEDILTESGEYVYSCGQESVFNGDGFGTAIFDQVMDRVRHGGVAPAQRQIAFVNLREIRDIKFGTRGPQVYNDLFYGTDLEVFAYGRFSIRVTDVVTFVRYFLPPGTCHCSFDDANVRSQIVAEFLQSFNVALNSLSGEYRISQLPSQSNNLAAQVAGDAHNAGTWEERFGFKVVSVAIENIEFSPESRELVNQFSSNKMNVNAYEGVSQQAANMAAQQKIAEGVQQNGLGDGGGLLFGMNMAQAISPQGVMNAPAMSFDSQIEAVKKLKDLLDAGILSQEEFDAKKKEIMGL